MFGINQKLRDILPQLEQYDYLFVHWFMFGSSGYKTQPNEIRKSFLKRKKEKENEMGKSIYNVFKISEAGVHMPSKPSLYKGVCLDELCQLNHYAIMSWEYFQKVKMTRGDVVSSKFDNDTGH